MVDRAPHPVHAPPASHDTPTLPSSGGQRGGWYVALQFALFGLIAFGPRNLPGVVWDLSWATLASCAGAIFFVFGALFGLGACLMHGRYFTPFIRPTIGSALLEHGPYRFVRHPIYSGLLLMGLGWGVWVRGVLTVGYVILLFLLLDRKARREERMLEERFPGYASYRKKVRRFIPYLY